MTPADLRQTEPSPAARLRQQANELMRLADELEGMTLAGEPDRAGDHDEGTGADHHVVDAPSPGGLIALKPAAHEWRMTEKRLRRIARNHGALHKIGGRWMVDHDKLQTAVFR